MKRGATEDNNASGSTKRSAKEELNTLSEEIVADATDNSIIDSDDLGLGHPLFQVEEKGGLGGERRIVLFEAQAAVRRPVGKIIFTLQSGTNVAHVDNVWVADGIRGLGFGRLLLHQCVATVAELGASKITLEAEEDTRRHDRLVGLYRSEGFAQYGDDSFVKFIPHNDGCYRKVPMRADVSHCLVRSRLFEQDQFLYVRVIRKPGVALGLVGEDRQVALMREQGSDQTGHDGSGYAHGDDDEDDVNDDDDEDLVSRGRKKAAPPHVPAQWWLLNRHNIGNDSDDETPGSGSSSSSSSGAADSSNGLSSSSKSSSGGGVAVTLQHTDSARFLSALPNGRVIADSLQESGTEDLAVVQLSSAHVASLMGRGGASSAGSSSSGGGGGGSSSSATSSGGGHSGSASGASTRSGLSGFYALRARHGGYLGFGLADGALSCDHLEPSAWRLTPERELEWRGPLLSFSPLEQAQQSRRLHTWAYANGMRRRYCDVANSPMAFGRLPGSRLSVKDVLQRLIGFHHPQRPDTELSVGSFALLCAERARAQGQPDWMQLVLLLHACGELRAHGAGFLAGPTREGGGGGGNSVAGPGSSSSSSSSPSAPPAASGGAPSNDAAAAASTTATLPEEAPWALCPQETWVVGCALPSTLPFAHLNPLSPDADHPTLGAPDGVYRPGHCGLTVEPTAQQPSTMPPLGLGFEALSLETAPLIGGASATTTAAAATAASAEVSGASNSGGVGTETVAAEEPNSNTSTEPPVAPADGSVVLCWGPNEYMYRMLLHNRCSAPWEALAALRLGPLKCWHSPPSSSSSSSSNSISNSSQGQGGAHTGPATTSTIQHGYARLFGAESRHTRQVSALGARDAAALPWAQLFDETVRGARTEAKGLHPCKAPQLNNAWPHYAAIVDKYLPNRLLDW